MGADIHSFAEVKTNGKWVIVKDPIFYDYGENKSTEPFGIRDYSVFGFLADVRNYSNCEPISETKGLPDDSEYLNTKLDKPERYSYSGYDAGIAYTKKGEIECDINYHSLSFLTLKELIDFDYEKTFWNRRITKTTIRPNGGKIINGAALAEEGEGAIITYREHLGSAFFEDIEALKTLGNPEDVRIVFWFDN